jgi:Tfp pilus assembly protein PilF
MHTMLDTGQIPLSGEALLQFRQGLAAASAGEFERAIACYTHTLKLRPDFYEAWYERGLAQESLGDYDQAIISFDQALQLCSRKSVIVEIWQNRGDALQYGLGKYELAIACYDEILSLDPTQELAWQSRGNALLFGLARPTEAIACYDRTLRLNSTNALAWRNRGNALVELLQYPEAIASYDRALALQPDDELSWYARNLALERCGLVPPAPPTTNPVWLTRDGFNGSTFIEEVTDAKVTYSSDLSVAREVTSVAQGQPILVIEDDWGKREILLDRPHYQIGRDPKNDIQLNSKFVSRHHAVLTRSLRPDNTEIYQIMDGDREGKLSTNGLLINGQKCRSRELAAEDVVVFGPHVQATYQIAPPPSAPR